MQESYARALRSFSSFQPGSNFKAWLFRILRNAFLNSRTAAAQRLSRSLEEVAPDSEALAAHTTPESLAIASADAAALQNAIEKLPPAYREVLLLADVEELSYADIASALQIPAGTVMSRLSRARRLLRQTFMDSQAKRAQR